MWTQTPASTLVVACSEGRLWRDLDVYLAVNLGVSVYDRLCLPGGPAALFPRYGTARAHATREALEFLIATHGIRHVVFVFHGAAEDGPEFARCADYAARGAAPEAQQAKDAARVAAAFASQPALRTTLLVATVRRGGLLYLSPWRAEDAVQEAAA